VQSNRLEVLSDRTRWRGRERWAPGLVLLTLLAVIPLELHSRYGHGDIDLYHRYAQAFWLSSPPLTALPVEYPPLSILPFSLTLLPPLGDYITVFAIWMLVIFAAAYLAYKRFETTRAAEVFAVYCVVGGLSTLLGRFDLVPALVTLGAYWAARHRRFDLAYALLALGTLIKLYPLLLLPILVLEHWRALGGVRLWVVPPRPLLRGVAIFAAAVAAGFAIARVMNPDGWLSALTYNTVRPIQVESVPATILWIGSWTGLPAWPDHSFHSFNLVGPLEASLSTLSTGALVAGCGWVYWRQLTGHMSFGRALLGCVLVVICTSRVFSPQYLIWALPFVAVVEGDYDLVWLAVCVLTTLIYPFAYRAFQLYGFGTPDSYPVVFLALIGARNALLVAATVRTLGPRLRWQPKSLEIDQAARRVA
jgi:Glycosyltransferase family 87